jgi:hypothetical protein
LILPPDRGNLKSQAEVVAYCLARQAAGEVGVVEVMVPNDSVAGKSLVEGKRKLDGGWVGDKTEGDKTEGDWVVEGSYVGVRMVDE